METVALSDVSSPFLVLLLLLVSALCVLCALSCSWVAGRKKRQRVANNDDANGLVMQMPKTMSRSKLKTPDRYSVEQQQLVILPIDDIGQSLAVPTIVVTPPSPLGVLAEVLSIQSDSSIGSANDLIDNDDDADYDDIGEGCDEAVSSKSRQPGILHREGGILIRGHFVRDSMRNKFGDDLTSVTTASGKGSKVSRSIKSAATRSRSSKSSKQNSAAIPPSTGTASTATSGSRLSRSQFKDSASVEAYSIKCDTESSVQTKDKERTIVLGKNGVKVDDFDDDDDDDFFNVDRCASRPRLNSIEPGSKRPTICREVKDDDTS